MYNSLSWFEVSAASHHQVIYLYVLLNFMVYGYLLVPRALTRVRLIPVSSIGYRPILTSIGGYRYRPILIWVSAPILVALSFVYLSQQSTLLQRTHAYSFKPIPYFRAYTPHTYITCTQLYPAQNRIFSVKKSGQPGISIGIGIAATDSIGVSGASTVSV